MADVLARLGFLCYTFRPGAIDAFPLGSALFVAVWTVALRSAALERVALALVGSVAREKQMTAEKVIFATGDLVVYPTHGVGEITAIEMQEIAGHTLNVFVVTFAKDRMTLRVPLWKAKVSGLRKLSSHKEMDAALGKLRGRSRAKRTMWSRRAQEYQAKIASGDPGSIAEVVRDLFRNTGQPEQSYSERQIYQAALDRFVREYAAVERIDEMTATQRVEQLLAA